MLEEKPLTSGFAEIQIKLIVPEEFIKRIILEAFKGDKEKPNAPEKKSAPPPAKQKPPAPETPPVRTPDAVSQKDPLLEKRQRLIFSTKNLVKDDYRKFIKDTALVDSTKDLTEAGIDELMKAVVGCLNKTHEFRKDAKGNYEILSGGKVIWPIFQTPEGEPPAPVAAPAAAQEEELF